MTTSILGHAQREPAPVVIVGSATRDVIHRHDQTVSQIGGTVWYAGLTFVKLGFDVRVVTRLAEADRGIGQALATMGLEARVEASPNTTVFHNIYGPGGRDDRRQRVESVALPITPESLAAALNHAWVCYLGPLHPEDISAEALSNVRRLRGPLVAMDVQGFTRRIDGDKVIAEVSGGLPALIAISHIVKASAAEACIIAGVDDVMKAARRLGEMAPDGEVIITRGVDGVILVRDGAIHHEAAPRIDNVDPTGAGDMFFASYIADRLRGKEPEDAVAFAVGHAAHRLQDPDRLVILPE